MSEKKDSKGFAHKLWRYLGAMMTEKKGRFYAVSLTRVLAIILFVFLMVKWMILEPSQDVPSSMLHTFWALMGIKSVSTVAGAIASRGTKKKKKD